MPAFQINDDEWSALFDEPSEIFKIYCALRRVMNFETGIAGLSPHRINEQFFRDVLSVEAVKGRKKSSPITRQKIRSMIERLENLGLVTHRGKLVFELILATLGNSAQNNRKRSATKPTTITTTNFEEQETSLESMLTSDDKQEQEPYQETSRLSTSNPPQVSGNKENIISTNVDIIQKKNKRACKLTDDFSVTEKHIEVATKNNLPNPHDEVEGFKDYHIGKGTLAVDWDRSFYTWLRNSKRWSKGGSNAVNKPTGYRTKTETYWDAISGAFDGTEYEQPK